MLTGGIARDLLDAMTRVHRSCDDLCRSIALHTGDLSRTTRNSIALLAESDRTIGSTVRASFQRTGEERSMEEQDFRLIAQTDRPGVNSSFVVVSSAGTSIYKPAVGEHLLPDASPQFPSGPGGMAQREVAAFRIDRLFGFGRVPATGLVNGPFGPGSNQRFVASRPPSFNESFDAIQMQQMAVLDYIFANQDRKEIRNYRITSSGSIVAIDNGMCFPHLPSPDGVQSRFVTELRGVPLAPEIRHRVDLVRADDIRVALRDLGLHDSAVEGTVERFEEIRRLGRVEGGNRWLP